MSEKKIKKKLLVIQEKCNNKIIISFFVNLATLGMLLLLFVPVEKTDDLVMKHILNGSMTGIPSAHLLYTNFLLGGLLKVLQLSFPSIAWFEVFQYVVLFVSFWLFTYLTWDEKDVRKSVLLVMPVLLFFGFETYIKLTFTKTAGIVIVAGMYSLGTEFSKEKPQPIKLLFSGMLILIGSCIRFNVVKMLIVFFAGSAVTLVMIRCRERKSLNIKKITKQGLIFLVICFAVCLVENIGGHLFRQNPEWADYKEYNIYKKELQDYGWPDYEDNIDQYMELGISFNDYNLWKGRDYGDPDILTRDFIKKICDIKEKEGIEKYINNINSYLKNYPLEFIRLNMFPVIFVLFIFVFFSDINKKKHVYVYPLGIALLLEYYLYCNGRYGKQHVDVAIFFAIAAFLSFLLRDAKIKEDKFSICGIAAVLVLTFAIHDDFDYMTSLRYDGGKYSISQESAKEVIDMLTEDKESLYILSDNEYYGLMRCLNTFEVVPPGSMSNIFMLSTYIYPSHRFVLDSFGYRNIYDSFCNENVYYVTSYGNGKVDIILEYIQEHYCENANYEIEESFNGVNIYRFFDEGNL